MIHPLIDWYSITEQDHIHTVRVTILPAEAVMQDLGRWEIAP